MQAILLFLLCIGSAFLGYATGRTDEQKSFQIEAVKRGHAAWVVQPDGSTVFVWAGEVQK